MATVRRAAIMPDSSTFEPGEEVVSTLKFETVELPGPEVVVFCDERIEFVAEYDVTPSVGLDQLERVAADADNNQAIYINLSFPADRPIGGHNARFIIRFEATNPTLWTPENRRLVTERIFRRLVASAYSLSKASLSDYAIKARWSVILSEFRCRPLLLHPVHKQDSHGYDSKSPLSADSLKPSTKKWLPDEGTW